MKAGHEFLVRIEDADTNNEMTNKAILEVFTNMANLHGNMVGHGLINRKNTCIKWIVLNWKFEVLKRPMLSDTITVKTWIQECEKILANREFVILDENGNIMVKATSKWIVLNSNTNRIEKLSDEIIGPYKSEPDCINFPEFEFEKNAEKDINILIKKEVKITKAMIDVNKHVHNTAYLELADEVLPNINNYEDIEIIYKKEIKPESTVVVEYAEKDNKKIVVIKDETEKNIHATIIVK